jgi:hypothetical protein
VGTEWGRSGDGVGTEWGRSGDVLDCDHGPIGIPPHRDSRDCGCTRPFRLHAPARHLVPGHASHVWSFRMCHSRSCSVGRITDRDELPSGSASPRGTLAGNALKTAEPPGDAFRYTWTALRPHSVPRASSKRWRRNLRASPGDARDWSSARTRGPHSGLERSRHAAPTDTVRNHHR